MLGPVRDFSRGCVVKLHGCHHTVHCICLPELGTPILVCYSLHCSIHTRLRALTDVLAEVLLPVEDSVHHVILWAAFVKLCVPDGRTGVEFIQS